MPAARDKQGNSQSFVMLGIVLGYLVLSFGAIWWLG